MLVEVRTRTSGTEKGYLKGEFKLTVNGDEQRHQLFEFVLSDAGTDKQQFIVRRGGRIFMNVQGEWTDDNPSLNDLEELQIALLQLIYNGLDSTFQRIVAEREGGQRVDEAARMFEKLGLPVSFEAEEKYTVEIIDLAGKLLMRQLFDSQT